MWSGSNQARATRSQAMGRKPTHPIRYDCCLSQAGFLAYPVQLTGPPNKLTSWSELFSNPGAAARDSEACRGAVQIVRIHLPSSEESCELRYGPRRPACDPSALWPIPEEAQLPVNSGGSRGGQKCRDGRDYQGWNRRHLPPAELSIAGFKLRLQDIDERDILRLNGDTLAKVASFALPGHPARYRQAVSCLSVRC